MIAQNGGYIVIDFAPIWKDTDAIGIEENFECSDYAVLDEYVRIFSYAMNSKKLIIVNNLQLLNDGFTNNFSGIVAHTFDEYDERQGSAGIRIPLYIMGTQGRKLIYLQITHNITSYTISWGE